MPYDICANTRANKGHLAVSPYTCPHCKKNGTIESPDICLKCNSFSDIRTLANFSCMPFQISIYLNRLCDLSLVNARKLFRLIRTSNDDNERSIALLEIYLASKASIHTPADAKETKKWKRLKEIWDESGTSKSRKRFKY